MLVWLHLLMYRGGYVRDALLLGCCILSPLSFFFTNSGGNSQVCFPGCDSAVKMSAYADDVMVIINKRGIYILEGNIIIFNKL